MNAHGQLTAAAAKSIMDEMNSKGYDVYYDHGDPSNPFVGTIAVSIEKELNSKNQIGQLDIAVVGRDVNKNKAIALIEIEETTDTPKTLIGDVFTTLMGNSVHLPGRENTAKVENWTTLIIIGKGAGHEDRNQPICDMANNAKTALGTEISKIGSIVITAFSEKKPLKDVLVEQIEKAIQRSA